ncbi:MAG: hypothetical protein D6698_04175 [Gammaproteobacteria bacterium]|nr:MAG: hypothetical protein D6698_04175 [Gammaproteobacteria bacterium]
MAYKLNIMDIMRACANHDYGYYDREIRGFPDREIEFAKNIKWLIPRWWTGNKDAATEEVHAMVFNAFLNEDWGSLSEYPDVAFKILCAIHAGGFSRFPKVTKKKTSKVDLLLAEHGVDPRTLAEDEKTNILADLGIDNED